MKKLLIILALLLATPALAQRQLTVTQELVNTDIQLYKDTTFVILYSGTNVAFKGENPVDFSVRRSVRPDSTYNYVIDKYYNEQFKMQLWIDSDSSKILYITLSYYPFTLTRTFVCK